jgi:hypothetical protein
VRRRTLVLQVTDNKANSVKSATPCGFKCRKNISKISFTFWVKDLNTFVKYNRPILKIKFPFSVFEVHNSGLTTITAPYCIRLRTWAAKWFLPKTAVPGIGYFAVCLDTEDNIFAIWETDDSAK